MIGMMVGYALFFLVLLLAVKPFGEYMARVYMGREIWLSKLLGGLEGALYRACGIQASSGMTWRQYLSAILLFSACGFMLLYALLVMQGVLPWNPRGLPGLPPDLAFAIAAGYVTNTGWQGYGGGEGLLSPMSQALGLTVQNFLSAAVGMSVMVALVRGIAGKERRDIGNFWADLVRGCLYILLPLAVMLSLALAGQGVVQTTQSVRHVPILQKPGVSQTLILGPVASEAAIAELGTDGGGYYNAGSAHPFANPTAITNLLEMLAVLLIPAALCATYGQLVGDRRQGLAMIGLMLLLFLPMLAFCVWQEQQGNPRLGGLGIDQTSTFLQSGGNMEGKEARFGIAGSALSTVATAAGSSGAANNSASSLLPLGGLVPMFLMQMGEVVFGGVGSGLTNVLLFTLITVFIAGLMVGRTPEYMGKKIQAFEMKMASIAILAPTATILIGTAIAVGTEMGKEALSHHGPHGFSEILYAFTSAAMNNGDAFEGLKSNTIFYNTILGLAMLAGRFWMMIPVLAIAGSLAAKKPIPASRGTLPTHTPLFVFMLASIILLGGVLTFVPALSLGPIVESLHLSEAK